MNLSFYHDWWFALEHFMAQGGVILWWLAAVVTLCWILVFERVIYLFFYFPQQEHEWIKQWKSRKDQTSWSAKAIRNAWLAQAEISLNKHLHFIKVLVAICPMLGLLGTVTGMITVFDIMATQGNSQARLMASGISLATLPTMAGMVATLAGVFVHSRLSKACHFRHLHLEKLLRSSQ